MAEARPHVRDSHAAAARFWAAFHLSEGLDLDTLAEAKPAAIARFVTATQTRIAALRKARAWDSSDGLAVWLHTARALIEPAMVPAVREIWQHLAQTGTNADAMTLDLLEEAGLPPAFRHAPPKGFRPGE